MPLLRPFTGLRPLAEHAAAVAAPPYDVLNTDEARARALGRSYSFLHISKPEIDLPEGTDIHDPEVYARGAANLARLVDEGILMRDLQPGYYIYRLVMGEHTLSGVVAAASVAAYNEGRICRHEFTRPDKEDDRVHHIDALNAQTGPVMLAYRQSADIDHFMKSVTEGVPEFDITADDGVRHVFWRVLDATLVARLTAGFEAVPRLYIADGHHRCAAASRVAAIRNGSETVADTDASHNFFLAVIFPDNQLRIFDYNRVVRDLNGRTAPELVKDLRECFSVISSSQAVRPACAGEFGMYLAGGWYRLVIRPEFTRSEDPVGRLDVSLLDRHCLEPLLAIMDPRRDSRIDFVGGIRGLGELEKRVDSGEMAVAFSLFPTSIGDLMAVSDSGAVMPPKSTWFEPKLADGLVTHVLD